MRRTFNLLLLSFLCTLAAFAAPGELKEKLAALKGITSVEQLESDVYPEKYLVRITQLVDPKNPEAGTPRVDFTVNKDHLRIIVLQKIINLMVKGRAELDLANQLFGQHDAVQITFTAVDSQVFTERLRVISVITQFTGGLNKERNIRLVLRKIVRTADIHQVFEQRRGIGMERRNNRYGRSPLP